jgi:hypothetical protein
MRVIPPCTVSCANTAWRNSWHHNCSGRAGRARLGSSANVNTQHARTVHYFYNVRLTDVWRSSKPLLWVLPFWPKPGASRPHPGVARVGQPGHANALDPPNFFSNLSKTNDLFLRFSYRYRKRSLICTGALSAPSPPIFRHFYILPAPGPRIPALTPALFRHPVGTMVRARSPWSRN